MRLSAAMLHRLPQRLLMAVVRGYRVFLSSWLGSSCRFEPTCSAYSLQALENHGALAGSYLTLRRLARCHPLCSGGHDPVPDHAISLFPWAAGASPTRHSRLSSTPTDKTSS